MAKDYYQILGVPRTATEDDIKKAFRKKAHEYHPDKGGGDDTKFKEINEAYQTLGNKQKRGQYDQFGSAFERGGGQPGFAWSDMEGASNPFGFGGFSQSQTFDFGDIGDVIGDMFGFGGATRTSTRTRARRGSDIESTVEISFDEAYRGTEKELRLRVPISCTTCDGSGNDPSATIETCTHCNGSGVVTQSRATFLGTIRTQSECRECHGTGRRSSKKCTACGGATVVNKERTITVKIPAGIDSSQSIRLAGKGESGTYGGPAGDLFIRVRIEVHPFFKRDGYDVKTKEEIPLSVLASGGTVDVRTPAGVVKLKIPANTKSGTSFRLHDKGFEKLTGRGRGDQFVTVHATVPTKLTAKQKKLLAEFEASLFEPRKKWL